MTFTTDITDNETTDDRILNRVEVSNRPFTEVEDQITLLERRGLVVDSKIETHNFLLFNNYYNIINRYGQYYFNSDSQTFEDSTNFKDILNLYYFDIELKNTFYKELMKVESNFKSVMSHIFCRNHDQEFSYLNPKNFDPNRKENHISFIGSLANQIKYNSGDKVPDNPIKHHMNKYGHVPFWVLVNYMYLTDTVKFYSAMNKSEQNEIAKIFSEKFAIEYNTNSSVSAIITPEQLGSFLKMLNDYRNLIAHDNFLFGSKIKTLPKYCECVFTNFYSNRSQVDRSLYDAMIIIRVFLENDSYKNLHNKLVVMFTELQNSNSQDFLNKILRVMGFPHNWNVNRDLL